MHDIGHIPQVFNVEPERLFLVPVLGQLALWKLLDLPGHDRVIVDIDSQIFAAVRVDFTVLAWDGEGPGVYLVPMSPAWIECWVMPDSIPSTESP